MTLLGEKHQPRRLDDFDYNQEWTKRLKNMTPLHNSIFYGPSSSGKHSRIMAMLAENFGNGVYNQTIKQVKASSKKNVTITFSQSLYHIEIDFKPYGTNDRIVISDFIKERCKSVNIITKQRRVIIIRNTESISNSGQKMLLAIVEKTSKRAAFIFSAINLSQIIMPLQSRCFMFRCRAPCKKEIIEILRKIASKEGIKLTDKRAREITVRSSHSNIPNLRNALHIFQMSHLLPRYKAYRLKYIDYMDKIIKFIQKKDIMKIREYIFILTAKNIDATTIITYLMQNFLTKNINTITKTDIVACAAKYQSLMMQGNKIPFYIEGFIADAVNIIQEKTYSI